MAADLLATAAVRSLVWTFRRWVSLSPAALHFPDCLCSELWCLSTVVQDRFSHCCRHSWFVLSCWQFWLWSHFQLYLVCPRWTLAGRDYCCQLFASEFCYFQFETPFGCQQIPVSRDPVHRSLRCFLSWESPSLKGATRSKVFKRRTNTDCINQLYSKFKWVECVRLRKAYRAHLYGDRMLRRKKNFFFVLNSIQRAKL